MESLNTTNTQFTQSSDTRYRTSGNVVDISDRYKSTDNDTMDSADEIQNIYKAEAFERRVSIDIHIPAGVQAKVKIEKNKIMKSSQKITDESSLINEDAYRIIELEKKLNAVLYQKSIVDLKNFELECEVNEAKEKISRLKEGNVMNIKLLIENSISNTYIWAISLLGFLCIVSGLSYIGLNFIPSPIDMSIFWTSLAGTAGFLIDFSKRDKENV